LAFLEFGYHVDVGIDDDDDDGGIDIINGIENSYVGNRVVSIESSGVGMKVGLSVSSTFGVVGGGDDDNDNAVGSSDNSSDIDNSCVGKRVVLIESSGVGIRVGLPVFTTFS
jgi:hypothetical protein